MQIFPTSFQKFWNIWELRVMVLLILSFQIILVVFGNKRKHYNKIWFRIILWLAYMLADWIATISLGVLSDKEGENIGDSVQPKYVIISLWAPILLLHLGGSDTITAYSMEDNELWIRHFFSFIVQVLVAIYIFLRAWTNTNLHILAMPIFIVGIIKMGERIWVLWSVSSDKFKESFFPDPDPGPDYAGFMKTYISAAQEGFLITPDQGFAESPSVGESTYVFSENNLILPPLTYTNDPEIVETAHNFLKIFKPLFVDLILSFYDVLKSRMYLQNENGLKVFEVLEIELGFMYDLFYTKALVMYSFMGSFLRFVAFSCNLSVLCAFFLAEKNQYPKLDVFIIYLLLLGAIILEIYSVISLLSSDWTMLWVFMHKNKVTSLMMGAISSIHLVIKSKRWSGTIGQFNLMSFYLNDKKQRCNTLHKIFSSIIGLKYREAFRKKATKCSLVAMITSVYQSYQKFKHLDNKIVTSDLKEIIFQQFVNKIKGVNSEEEVRDEEKVAKEIKKFCDDRGNKVLESYQCSRQLGWSVGEEFDKSILLWHIATDLGYYVYMPDEDENANKGSNPNYREASKMLSEYMLYLLVMRPSMLPNGIVDIRLYLQDTCAEATKFFKDRELIKNKKEAYGLLLTISSEGEKVPPSLVKGDRSKSVLFDACRLAIRILKLRHEEDWISKKMWELIAQVWVEMLGYAASHCQGIHHAQQLRHGGELLTHVWLLLAHLGITDQFQIPNRHARTKLIRK